MTTIMDRLKADHRNTVHLLDLLERELDLLEAGEVRPNYELISTTIDYFLTYPDLRHHPLEDVVFRLLQQRAPQAAVGIDDVLADHQRLAELTRRFSEAMRQVLLDLQLPRDRLVRLGREFLDHYRDHIGREESVFFPAAQQELTAEDWRVAEAEVQATGDPLFGPVVEERFARLRAEIDDIARDAH